jgi:predicted nucleic acid-binding Zn ribbon protein
MGACKDLYEEFKSEPRFDVSGSQKAIQNLLNRDAISFLGTGIYILLHF